MEEKKEKQDWERKKLSWYADPMKASVEPTRSSEIGMAIKSIPDLKQEAQTCNKCPLLQRYLRPDRLLS